MKNMNRLSLFLTVILLATLAIACRKDPEQAKREFMRSGDAYMEQKKFAEAAVQYRNAVRLDPRFGEAHKKLAFAFASNGDGAAYKEFIAAADLLPQDVEAQLNAAKALLAARQYDEAKTRAQDALQVNPRSPDALILRATALAGLNELEDALSEVEEAIRADPSRIASYATLGRLQIIRGDRRVAEAAFRRAVEVAPKSVEARLALVNYLWAVGRRSDAEVQIGEVLALEPKNLLANRAMALFYLGSERVTEAEQYLKTLAEAGNAGKLALADYYLGLRRPSDSRRLLEEVAAGGADGVLQAKLRLAGLDAGGGDLTTAMRRVDEVLAKEPKSPDALGVKVQLLASIGKLDEALAVAQTATRARPQSASAQYTLGQTHIVRHELEEAKLAFTEALKLDPRMATAELELAKLHFAGGRFDQAEQFAVAAAKKTSGYLEAYLLLARLNLVRGDVAKAEPAVRALVKVLPDHPAVQGELGQVELLKNNRRAAREAFGRALAKNPTQLDALAGLITMDLQDKRPDAAKTRIETAVNAAPRDAALLVMAGRTYANLGDTVAAEGALRRAMEADPKSMDAYSVLGEFYIAQRRVDAAIAQFTTITQKQSKPVAAYTILGMLLKVQNKPAEAREKYLRALEIDPQAPVAANNLAWMYAESGTNLDAALELAKTAKARLPDRPDINDTLGWVYYKKGLYTMAVPPLLESVGKDPKNPTYHYHLGLVYVEMGDTRKARSSFEKSLSLNSTSSGADEVRRALANLKS
jgi:tetratricopeptide (TPR) repeat protein